MSKFKKKKSGDLPAISTASLPDIVFMLLFFFMVATVMRDSTLMVSNTLPAADQVQKLDKKDLKLMAKLNSSGDLILYAGNRVIGKGKISSLLKQMPLDGLQVGKDESGLVGDYKNTFVFDGRIKRVKIKIN